VAVVVTQAANLLVHACAFGASITVAKPIVIALTPHIMACACTFQCKVLMLYRAVETRRAIIRAIGASFTIRGIADFSNCLISTVAVVVDTVGLLRIIRNAGIIVGAKTQSGGMSVEVTTKQVFLTVTVVVAVPSVSVWFCFTITTNAIWFGRKSKAVIIYTVLVTVAKTSQGVVFVVCASTNSTMTVILAISSLGGSGAAEVSNAHHCIGARIVVGTIAVTDSFAISISTRAYTTDAVSVFSTITLICLL
jgi:hypothetical protein